MTFPRVTAWRAGALASAAVLGLALAASSSAVGQTFTVLYSFAGYPMDGDGPAAGLFMDAAGNLYGTTAYGGNTACSGGSGIGCGTVFELETSGVETILHNFTGTDGANPFANLIMDAKGNFYGTTTAGGLLTHCTGFGSYPGCGVVFKLSDERETVLHAFTGGEDGAFPWAGVIADARGNLYGTTNAGGGIGGGVAFKLAGTKETVLHSFTGGTDGNYLTSGLLMDATGNLYGTDFFGGDVKCDYPNGCGVVFKLAGKHLTALHSFKGPPDGADPYAGLIMDAEGNLYGTTYDGGIQGNLGTVFKVSQAGKESVLYRYKREQNGYNPGGLVRDAQGNLYGTTEEGGLNGDGVVYKITADGKETILHNFCSGNCSDGAYPISLIMDAQGNLYGTAYGGGTYGKGTIFKITLPPTHPQ
jgi:uncharacterized repeat protein (TIGR03803 family)